MNITRRFKLTELLVQSKVLPDCHIVLTSRHEAGRKVMRYCDTLWEIVGFTKEDAKSFIFKYFSKMNNVAEKLLAKLDESDNLRELTLNPLNTTLLCVLWEDFEGAFPSSRSQLYIEIVLCVLRRYEKKNGLSSSNEDLMVVYKKELMELGRIALQFLCKGELYFEEREFKCDSSVLTKFGFLSIQAGGSKRKLCIRYGFLHKSFQEFFSGFCLAFQIIEGKVDCDSVVTDKRYRKELRQVFLFMSGIVASQCEETAVRLVKSITKNINLLGRTSHSKADKNLQLAFDCITECTKYQEDLHSRLVLTLGEHFSLEAFSPSTRRRLEVLFEFLSVNTSLTNLDLSGLEDAREMGLHLEEMDGYAVGIGDAGAASLSKALKVNSSLTNLNLSWNCITDSGASTLSQALKTNSTLTILDLSSNRIGESGVACLSGALKVNSTLASLRLGNNDLSDPGAASLSEALKVNSTLVSLDLSSNKISDPGAVSLSRALAANASLTDLNLRDNWISATGAASLFHALTLNSCSTNLDLRYNLVCGSDTTSLFHGLEANTLARLDLYGNAIDDFGAASLSKARTSNFSLTSLNLSENSVGDSGAASLATALTITSCLTNLNLRRTEMGDSGVACLAKALTVNSCLTNLDLSSNTIGDPGAACLAKALTVNSCLTNLDLSSNTIGDPGAACLAKALTVNSCLTNLDLSCNTIGDPGAACLAKALTVNSCLTNFNLACNEIGDPGAACLAMALTANTTLTNLDLFSRYIGVFGAAALSEACKLNNKVDVYL